MDDSWDPQKAKRVLPELRAKCDFLFLQTTSTAFMAVYPEIVKDNTRLYLSVGPATTEISNRDDNIIRNNLDTAREQADIAGFITRAKVRNLLVIRETERNAGYTESAMKQFRASYQGPLVEVSFSADHFDLTELLRVFHNGSFDMVYVISGGAPAEVAVIVQNLHREQAGLPVMTTPWVRGKFFTEALGPYSGHVVIPEYTLMSSDNKPYMEFTERYHKRFGTEPGYTAYYSYDLAHAFIEALNRTGKTDAKSLISEMTKRQFDGVNGLMKFTSDGDVDSGLHFYRIEKDQYEIIE
jgi:ABC-type branched-subunit amino acid transport system substrate-binding protein